MMISVKNAYANNLKNISVDIPIGKISAITGVSGSGKSTLLKEILGAYGAHNFTMISSKTVQDSLRLENNIFVDEIENLPNTAFIDVKNFVTNPLSTVSTVSGIHELLRNIFTEYGSIQCEKCGNVVTRNYSLINKLQVDLRIDNKFKEAISFIEENGVIIDIKYFNKNGKATVEEKSRALATVYFEFNIISENIIREFNRSFGCSIYVWSNVNKKAYDFIKEIECPVCNSIGANLNRSRFSYITSYDDGGGACKCCHGSGKNFKIKIANLFQDTSKGILEGASPVINEKGIKYSTITEKFISALYDALNLDIHTPISFISDDKLKIIINGYNKEITFMDRVGGKKTLIFEGVSAYLENSFRTRKNIALLEDLFENCDCIECEGGRLDHSISRFRFCGESLNSLIHMSLDELGEWCKKNINNAPGNSYKYLKRIITETDIFNLLSCGHLALFRASSTLSGGELQRIRIGALLNSNMHGLCYLLDEPSSGLHYSDIENLSLLLHKICEQNNTVIMVEHNKKMLSHCDYIIDMGPCGGRNGGNVLFNSPINEIKSYNTATVNALYNSDSTIHIRHHEVDTNHDFLTFKNLMYNNLKNVSVKFPRNSFTTVCGVSGSGKSTFIKQAVYNVIRRNPQKYGFKQIDYLGQENKAVNKRSTLASLIQVGEHIAKLYEKASNKTIKKNNFLIGSVEGKCPNCNGKGILTSETDELIGVCEFCNGHGFNNDVLTIKIDGLNIYELYNMNLEDLVNIIKDVRLKNIAKLGCRLGIGYLALSRLLKTMSKGEIQRASLIKILAAKETKHLIILDEPSKGLHAVNVVDLVYTLKELAMAGNTILTVEHNPDMIRNADYIIEFGGTGVNGGHLLFQGILKNIKDTPTAVMLSEIEMINHFAKGEKNNIIKIECNGSILKYVPHNLYLCDNIKEILTMAAKQARENFLSVAIPNNPIFSKINKSKIEANTPIMFIIDFKEHLKYFISISEAIGIQRLLCEQAVLENKKDIARYVFDIRSITGKCPICKGTGRVWTVDKELFLNDGDLNLACKKFLKNSTDFIKLSKAQKKEGVDISKPLREMTEIEEKVLFYGSENIHDVDGKRKRWEGIIPYFIKYHDYYPEKCSQKAFDKKSEMVCPVCKGTKLKHDCQNYRCFDLTFEEWLSMSIGLILKRLEGNKDGNISKIKERLQLFKEMGIDNLSLGTELILLDTETAAKVKLLSFWFNRIYDAGVVVKNIPDSNSHKLISKLLNELTNTNTVWIV